MWTKIERWGKYLLFGFVTLILLTGCTSFSQTTVLPTALPPTVIPTPDPLALKCIHQTDKHDFCYAGDLLAEDVVLLEKATDTFCLNNDDFFCSIFVWKDEVNVARSFPLTDAEQSSLLAKFTTRPQSGIECFRMYSNGEVIYSSGTCN